MAEKCISDLFFLPHKKILYVIDHFRSYMEETDCPKIPHLKIQVGKFGTAFVSYLGTNLFYDNDDEGLNHSMRKYHDCPKFI